MNQVGRVQLSRSRRAESSGGIPYGAGVVPLDQAGAEEDAADVYVVRDVGAVHVGTLNAQVRYEQLDGHVRLLVALGSGRNGLGPAAALAG